MTEHPVIVEEIKVPHALEHLRGVKVNCIGGGIMVELLKRYNLKEIRVIEKVVEEEQLYLDPFYNEEHIGTIPKYSPFGNGNSNTCISSFALPNSTAEFKKILKGMDVVIGGYDYEIQKEAAIAASELGMPLITWGVITTILPDGISFEEIEFSPSLLKIKMGAALNTVIRCFQVIEMIKLFTGVGEPFFPPNALAPEFDRFKLNLKMNKIKLKLKVKDRRSRY